MTRFDRWSRDGMPEGEALRQIQRGIDATMRGVMADSRHGISPSASMIPDHQREETPPAPNAGSVPITTPPGVEIIDRMVEAQSRKERLAALQQAAELAEISRRLDHDGGPKIQTEWNPFDAENMKK